MFIMYMVFFYMQVAAIGKICSYNIWHYAVKSFHSLILHVLRCTVNNHHHYHSSIVCESTSGDSTPTTLRVCVLPCDCMEYYVIPTLHPWAQSIPYYHISPYCGL